MSVDLEPVRVHVERLRYCKEKMAELTEMQEQSRAAVEEVMGSAELGTLTHVDVADNVSVTEPVIRWKHTKQRVLDQKELKVKYPQIRELLLVTRETRRFEVL